MVFYTKPTLRFMRYYILFLFIGLPLGLTLLALDRTIVQRSDVLLHVFVCLGLTFVGVILINVAFWEKCFATLHISDTVIRWKCPFRKTICLNCTECNYIGVQTEESHNGLSYPFVYLSVTAYPNKYIGKINRIRCTKSFIKFWYSEDLCAYLISRFPTNMTGELLSYRIRNK